MKSGERREDILKRLVGDKRPIKGSELAQIYNITRQVVVKDIAILRARGEQIVATPDGYTVIASDSKIRDIIVTQHDSKSIKREMEIIVKYGGVIEDVIVSHPVYGEIKGMIMVKNLNDLEKFIERYNKNETLPLSSLTNGIHMHTISVYDMQSLDLIKNELKRENFLI